MSLSGAFARRTSIRERAITCDEVLKIGASGEIASMPVAVLRPCQS
jgi:hypothetical protein